MVRRLCILLLLRVRRSSSQMKEGCVYLLLNQVKPTIPPVPTPAASSIAALSMRSGVLIAVVRLYFESVCIILYLRAHLPAPTPLLSSSDSLSPRLITWLPTSVFRAQPTSPFPSHKFRASLGLLP